ncbi:neuronal acetylcholine receptor subunit alpha-6 [Elysia marginata]|uniref:Neuronal acetylcholine receptor subunit alpha-6 n=1 Tax=Elysia marginata TaxID=1093978 RepID=A0AAV4HG46_9GAST|nr:neuronal acetylcholine receptor subunit alpha-6 [Elysia marginata]
MSGPRRHLQLLACFLFLMYTKSASLPPSEHIEENYVPKSPSDTENGYTDGYLYGKNRRQRDGSIDFLGSADSAHADSENSTRVIPMTDEQRLFRRLLQGYDRNTRPVYNASEAVKVYIGITLTQIFDLEWRDEKFQWNPEDFNGLKVLRMPCRHIWKPDIVLYNSVEDYTDGYMQSLAMVHSDGTVFWPPIVRFQSTCKIDITFFPFDDQLCKMKLGSWAYDGFQVDVYNRTVPVDLSNYVSNGEWQLMTVTAKRNVVHYPCCPEPFPDVIFTIHLRRRTLYYTYNVIIPCVMLSCLTLLVFWMSPTSGEKVTLGLTVLLAFSVFMLLIAENMPATSNFVPLIGMYITSVMGITSLSVVLAVMVSNISQGGRNERSVPGGLRVMAVFLARIMCMRLHYLSSLQTRERPTSMPGHSSRASNFSEKTSSVAAKSAANNSRARRSFYKVGHGYQVSNDSGCGLLDFELGDATGPAASRTAQTDGTNHLNMQQTPLLEKHPRPTGGTNILHNRRASIATIQNRTTPATFTVHNPKRGDSGGQPDLNKSNCKDVDTILALLKSILMKENEKERSDLVRLQWEEVAIIIDRFLFYIFLALTLVATLTTLVIMPLLKPAEPQPASYP